MSQISNSYFWRRISGSALQAYLPVAHTCTSARPLTKERIVSPLRFISLLLCVGSTSFFSACGLIDKPSLSDRVSQEQTLSAESEISSDEGSVRTAEHDSLAKSALPAEDVLAKENGIYHRVRRGQTLSYISQLYQLPVETLMRANRLIGPGKLRPGTSIFIPQSSGPMPPNEAFAGALSWPLRGRVTANFGPRGRRSRHKGIDIDGDGGDEIRAAAAGTVIQTGTRGKYGRMVLLDHGEGVVTLYAHVGKIIVRTGDRIERGAPIAEVGRSGNARGTHLHFEVQHNGRPVDPVSFLQTDPLVSASRR